MKDETIVKGFELIGKRLDNLGHLCEVSEARISLLELKGTEAQER